MQVTRTDDWNCNIENCLEIHSYILMEALAEQFFADCCVN